MNTTPFRLLVLPPAPMLLLAYIVEFYNLLPARIPLLAKVLPKLPGDVSYLEPGLFSICTHLFGSVKESSKSVTDGGLGYQGIVTTLEGMCQELLDWNREQEQHRREASQSAGINGTQISGQKTYTTKYFRHSVGLAEEIRKQGAIDEAANA